MSTLNQPLHDRFTLAVKQRFHRLSPRATAVLNHLNGMRLASKDERAYCPAVVLEQHARERPQDIVIKWQAESFSWARYNDEANRVAAYFLAQDYRPGDCVAMVMENSPQYLFLLAGLNKIGVISALINTGLAHEPLAHVLRQCAPRTVIADQEFMPAVMALHKSERDSSWALLCSTQAGDSAPALSAVLPNTAENPPDTQQRRCADLAMYLFTSGTTGMPKAARITNRRLLTIAHGVGGPMTQMGPDDTLYLTLPLHHATGAMAGFGTALLSGAAIGLRRKFSASEFWDDCVRFDATVFNYIGEICRYLLASPPHPKERAHRLRVAVGAGLRPDVWPGFQQRFGIGRIAEGYSATEGNIGLFNLEGKVGMIGRLLPGQAIVRVDADTEEFLRDKKGRLQPVSVGEQGILIGRIGKVTPFDGYLDRKRSEDKIIRNAFGDGSDWFNSGDLVQLHPWRWVSFADRLGDTFRWKGENVSTQEVGHLLNACSGVAESNVYGVSVPGYDGRAGMAAVVPSPDFDIQRFSAAVRTQVPALLRPVFIRLVPELAKTASFKYVKVPLQREGFDPAQVSDPLYLWNSQQGVWESLDADRYAKIRAGTIRL